MFTYILGAIGAAVVAFVANQIGYNNGYGKGYADSRAINSPKPVAKLAATVPAAPKVVEKARVLKVAHAKTATTSKKVKAKGKK